MHEPESENDEHAQTYQEWLRERRSAEISPGFSDEVMRQLPADPPVSVSRASISLATWAKAAVITLAALVSVGRYLIVAFALFIG